MSRALWRSCHSCPLPALTSVLVVYVVRLTSLRLPEQEGLDSVLGSPSPRNSGDPLLSGLLSCRAQNACYCF